MWEFWQKCSCVKIWYHVLTLPVAMLSMRFLHSATVLYSNSYYTVVASIFLISAASCKAICRVASVRTSDYSQPFWLKWHALLMPHVLIKYAHVLICISAGEGSRHFSAFHNKSTKVLGTLAQSLGRQSKNNGWLKIQEVVTWLHSIVQCFC